MKLIRDACSDEVVAAFARAERKSTRFPQVEKAMRANHLPSTLLDSPDFHNAQHNAVRAGLLNYRGWPDQFICRGLPHDIQWHMAAFDASELFDVKLINCDPWLRLSGETRCPANAAKAIRRQDHPDGVALYPVLLGILEALRCGTVLDELILLREGDSPSIVALEGNMRLTAYADAPDLAPKTLNVFLGTAQSLRTWAFW